MATPSSILIQASLKLRRIRASSRGLSSNTLEEVALRASQASPLRRDSQDLERAVWAAIMEPPAWEITALITTAQALVVLEVALAFRNSQVTGSQVPWDLELPPATQDHLFPQIVGPCREALELQVALLANQVFWAGKMTVRT